MSLAFSPRTARINGGDKQRIDTLPDNLIIPDGTLSPGSGQKTPKKLRKVTARKRKERKDETLMNPLDLAEVSPNVDMQPANSQLFSDFNEEERESPRQQDIFHSQDDPLVVTPSIQERPRANTMLEDRPPLRSFVKPESSAPAWEPSRDNNEPLQTFGSAHPDAPKENTK